MRIEPYICLGDVEVGNALRTLAYLEAGLSDSRWESFPETVACVATDLGPYTNPAADDAPWYSSSRPDSAGFLGFFPHDVTMRAAARRSASATEWGASLGPQGAGGFVINATGFLFADGAPGMAYGERWLVQTLVGAACGPDSTLKILPACPPPEQPAQWRNLPRTGLIDGPTFVDVQGIPSTLMQAVTFQLASESPFLLGDPLVVADADPPTAGALQHYPVSVPEWVGDAALRVTIDVGPASAMTNFRLTAVTSDGGAAPCDTGVPWKTWWTVLVPTVPAGHRLVIDGVDRVFEVTNPASGEVHAMLDAAEWDGGPFPWPELGACSDVCIVATSQVAPSGSHMVIDQVLREL